MFRRLYVNTAFLQDAETCVTLCGALDAKVLSCGEARAALCANIAEEAGKYGRVVEVAVAARPRTPTKEQREGERAPGDVVVQFGDALGAGRAAEALRGRLFCQQALVPLLGTSV